MHCIRVLVILSLNLLSVCMHNENDTVCLCVLWAQFAELSDYVDTKYGIKVDSSKRVRKDQESIYGQQKETFNGNECLLVLDNCEDLMDYVFTHLMDQDDPDLLEKRELYLRLWICFRSIYVLLKTPIPCQTLNSKPSEEDRRGRVTDYQALANDFYDAYCAVSGHSTGVSVYVHILHVHMADCIREHGNVDNYACQSIEHNHVFTKYAFRWLTNKRVNERVLQVFNWVSLFLYHRNEYPKAAYRCKNPVAADD